MWGLPGLSLSMDLQQRIAANNAAAAATMNILQKPDHVFDLAVTMNYVDPMDFKVSDAIREVIKNALDGALAYSRSRLQLANVKKLEADGRWTMQPVNLPKQVQQLGFKYGYESKVTLVLGGVSNPNSRSTANSHWSSDPRAVAQIRAYYASRDYVDIAELDHQDESSRSLEDMGLVLYQLIAENYAVDFAVNNFIFLGSSVKVPNAASRTSLPFGEGLKLAAIACLNQGFSLEVTGGGMTYRYDFSQDHNDSNAQYLRAVCSRSHLLLESNHNNPDLIQVKLSRLAQWNTDTLFDKTHYRCLQLPKENLCVHGFSGGEVLLHAAYAGKVYCRGIFVAECHNLLGIDLDFLLSRDKNKPSSWETFQQQYGALLQEVLTDASQAHKNVAHQLIERMKNYSKTSLEAEVITSHTCDPVGISAKALATKFRQIHDESALPCLKSQVPFIYKNFPLKVPVPVSKYLLDCLFRGGYQSPVDTLYSYFSNDNKSTIDLNWYEDVISTALYNLKTTGYDLSRTSLVFLDHNKLPSKKSLCHCVNGHYYISDFLLLQDYGGSHEQKAYMLGYHIALECDGDELYTQYVRNSAIMLNKEEESEES